MFGDNNRTILRANARPGEVIELDASASESEEGPIQCKWYTYPEPGTFVGSLPIKLGSVAKAKSDVPTDASGSELHLICQATSAGRQVPLTSYRRLVVTVGA